MKLIISRKGFDSAAGGVASPVLPDGSLRSLPIPDRDSPLRYRDIEDVAPKTAQLVSALSRHTRPADGAHLDPDLDVASRARAPGWRPAFGQAGAALKHLRNHGVGAGDLFLFFGWFRAVDRVGRGWRFRPGAPDLHILYGWLQVADVVDLTATRPGEPWRDHVHCQRRFGGENALFIARNRLSLDGVSTACAGGGVWSSSHPVRVLTTPGHTRSHWTLPRAFAPIPHADGLDCLSYHTRPTRWRVASDTCELQVTPRGQEFVLDLVRRPGLNDWLRSVFESG